MIRIVLALWTELNNSVSMELRHKILGSFGGIGATGFSLVILFALYSRQDDGKIVAGLE